MKKKLLFSMAAVSILAMGFIIWSCGDDEKKDEVKPQLAGIAAVGGAGQYICSDNRDLTVQLVDAFGNAVKEPGKEVTFTVESGTASLDPTKTVTNANGLATTSIDASEIALGKDIVVVARWREETVVITLTRVDFPHQGCFIREPVFRLNTLVIDGDATNNELGKLASLLNLSLQDEVDNGDINLLFVLKDLTEENRVGPTTVIWSVINGLCGAPDGPPMMFCNRIETEFFINPASYNFFTEEVHVWTDGNITEGNFSVFSSGVTISISYSFVFDAALDIPLCDLNIAGAVNEQLTEIAGSTIEGTYCPDGCGTIAGTITEADFCEFLRECMRIARLPWSPCQEIIDLYGLTVDTDCAGEPAFSARMLYSGTSVTLTKPKKGFTATIKIINADGSHGDTYKFEDHYAWGIAGGFTNLLTFGAAQKSRQNPNNKDSIGFNYSLWGGEGHENLMDIPPEGVKLPIGRWWGEYSNFVAIHYAENCNFDVKPASCDWNIIDSVESNSYLTIYSFEHIGEWQSLLVGSIQCTLILKDGSRRIIEGNFSIPIEEVL